MNFVRGIRLALKYSVIGFMIPVVVIGLIAIYHFTIHDVHPMDRENELSRLPAMILVPSIGLSLLLGLAALGAFTPKNGMSFTRSLIVISFATLIAVLATRPYIPRKTADPNAWMETVIPLAVAVSATLAVILYGRLLEPNRETTM